jgi:hypothetical protein
VAEAVRAPETRSECGKTEIVGIDDHNIRRLVRHGLDTGKHNTNRAE